MYIYLDSYNFSNIAAGIHELPPAIKNGRAKFIYTLSHIVEALPKNEKYLEDSIKRLRLIMDDRYGVSAYSFFEVMDIERKSERLPSIEIILCKREDLLTNDFGTEQIDNFDLTFKIKFLDLLQNISDPNEKRKMRAKFIKHGKLRKENFFPLLLQQTEQMAASAEKKLPELVPLFSSGGMIDYITKKVDRHQFSKNMRIALLHPVVLANLAFNKDFDIRSISEFFWTQNENLANKIQPMLEKAMAINCLLRPNQSDFHEFAKSEMLNEEYFNHISQQIFGDGRDKPLRLMPGTRNFLGCLIKLTLVRIKSAEIKSLNDTLNAKIKIKSGDFGDLSHSFYQPYVDVFCCDRGMEQIIRSIAKNPSNICSSHEQLMSL